MDHVREVDHGHYLAGTLFPSGARDGYFALRAFNAETAAVADQVKDPNMGRFRFQFWRDTIRHIYENDGSIENPVGRELQRAVLKHRFTRRWIDRMLDAREADLRASQPATVAEIESYTENTAGSLLYLTLESLGVRDMKADHAASHVGKAIGLVTVLRGTPHHIAKGRCYLPQDLVKEHKLNISEMMKGQPSDELAEIAFSVASTAKRHLNTARNQTDLPESANPALLPALVCDQYLDRLRKVHFNLFDPRLAKSGPLMLQFQMMKHSWRGTF